MGSVRRCLTAFVACLVFGVGTAAAAAPIHAHENDGRGGPNEGSQGSNCEESDRSHPGRGHERDRDGGEEERCDHRGRGQERGEDGDEGNGHPGRGREKDHEGDEDERRGHPGRGRGKDHDGDDDERAGPPGRQGENEDHSADTGNRESERGRAVGGDRARAAPGRAPPGRAPPVPSPAVTPVPEETAGRSLDLTVRASRVVARVGDEIDYTITVTNTGAAELVDVVVVDLVPPELDVVSVPLAEGVEAAQAGRSPRGEDVVWILEALPPRASVELSWTGIVSEAGDLEATNVVTATSGGSKVRASTTTFLAAATGVAAQGTAPEVMPKRIVSVTRVLGTDAPSGAPLPVTALAIEWLLALGLAIVFAGMVLLILGRPPLMVGRGSAYALALLAVVYAATFITDSSTIPQPRPSETIEDQVRGKRIFRDRVSPTAPPEPPEQRGRGADEDAGPVAAGREEPAEEVLVRTVRTVKVPVDATPIPSGSGANVLQFSWDEPTRRILQATSSVGPIERIPSYELQTSLGMAGDALEATLVLRNLSDELIAVRGVLSHDVRGDGVSLSLRSSRIDVILRPRGQVTATFSYVLPSGDYQAGANFVAD